eukprot:TRINITY_DN5923_c0_g1_i1.p1 TRINITY_DN5923_c0_g1~~TRINITY_DN5923_c0_g1_i1.p1  ORF type:complete len:745 (-),score=233.82 TRINITY_DN5923_c0_g1_i1:672-2906(-)
MKRAHSVRNSKSKPKQQVEPIDVDEISNQNFAKRKKRRIKGKNESNHPIAIISDRFPLIVANLRGITSENSGVISLCEEEPNAFDPLLLPSEVFVCILSFLKPLDLCRACRVNWEWNYACEEAFTWKNLFNEKGWNIDSSLVKGMLRFKSSAMNCNPPLNLEKREEENNGENKEESNDSNWEEEISDPNAAGFDWKGLYRFKYTQMQNWYSNRFRESSFHVMGTPKFSWIFHEMFLVVIHGQRGEAMGTLSVFDLALNSENGLISNIFRPSSLKAVYTAQFYLESEYHVVGSIIISNEPNEIRGWRVDESGYVTFLWRTSLQDVLEVEDTFSNGNKFGHAFSVSKTSFTFCVSSIFYVWDAESGQKTHEIQTGQVDWAINQSILDENRLIFTTHNCKLVVYNLKKEEFEFVFFSADLNGSIRPPQGSPIQPNSNGLSMLFATPEPFMMQEKFQINSILLNNDKEDNSILLAAMESGNILQFNLKNGSRLDEFVDHMGPVRILTPTTFESLFLSTSQDGTLKSWNCGGESTRPSENFIMIHQHQISNRNPTSSPRIVSVQVEDHRLLAVSDLGKVKMWNTETGHLLFSLGYRSLGLARFNDQFLVCTVSNEIIVRDYRYFEVPQSANNNLNSNNTSRSNSLQGSPRHSPPPVSPSFYAPLSPLRTMYSIFPVSSNFSFSSSMINQPPMSPPHTPIQIPSSPNASIPTNQTQTSPSNPISISSDSESSDNPSPIIRKRNKKETIVL